MKQLEYTVALDAVLELIGKANKYIEITSPWDLAKESVKSESVGYSALSIDRSDSD